MNILIAPDSFKNALPASEVAESLARGIARVLPDARIRRLPMADGGEGTVESVTAATGGRRISVMVKDPLGREVEASFGLSGDGEAAVIEMASASGIELLAEGERDPWKTSTFGTGQLIRAAMDEGCSKILLGIGGSATNDFGAGMAEALGARFLDSGNHPVRISGGTLGKVEVIDLGGLDPRIGKTEIIAACDVTNPLTGPEGAARVFAPQKGAGPDMVELLDANLAHMAELVRKQTGRDLEHLPGAGAAGGLGAGLVAFLEAELTGGVYAVAGLVGLKKHIRWSDIVITGEGRLDSQTQYGKTPWGVARMAKEYGKPVLAVAGSIAEGAGSLYDLGIDVMSSILVEAISLGDAIPKTAGLLEAEGERIGRFLKLGVRTQT